MADILHTCFSGPVLPASALLLVIVVFWGFVILGAMDVAIFDLDLDLDIQAGSEIGWFPSLGLVALRFLNVGQIPLMIWLSIFALSLWIISVSWHDPSYNDDNWLAVQVLIRNVTLALVATKVVTQPLLQFAQKAEIRKAADLVGKTCVVSTSEVTHRHGQAKFHTEGAPLLLHVRTREGSTLMKGDLARIIDFDPANLIYYIEKLQQEVDA
jgi:hypothetical protein